MKFLILYAVHHMVSIVVDMLQYCCSGLSEWWSPTSVAMSGLPSGRGCIGVPKCKRNTRKHSQRWWYIVLQLGQFCLPQFPICRLHPVQYALYSGQCTSARAWKSSGGGPSLQVFPAKVGSSGRSSEMIQASASLSGASSDGPLPEML